MHVIEAQGLTGRPREAGGCLDVTMNVPPGVRLAVIGAEGAGKTELVRLLLNLDLLRAGSARVLGRDIRSLRGSIFSKIGYVPQHNLVPLHMTVRHYLSSWRGFYPTWDPELELRLGVTLKLPMRVRALYMERPLRLKAALLSAIAFRPELLVMDGPFDVLDEEVRGEILAALDQALDRNRSTVVITARTAADVEGVCDHIAWLQEGRIQVCDRADALREQYRRITVTFANPPGRDVELPPHWILLDARGRRLHAVDTRFGDGATLRAWQAPWPGAVVEVRPMELAEIGEALARLAATTSGGRAP